MTSPSTPKPTKNEKRETARQQARELWAAQEKKRKLRSRGIQAGVIAAIAIAVIIIIIVSVTASKNNAAAALNPANTNGYGFTFDAEAGGDINLVASDATPATKTPTPTELSSDKVNISVYLDYGCPHCAEFEAANSDFLEEIVKSGEAQVTYLPLLFISEYSVRATNATACVADSSPESVWAFNQELFVKYEESAAKGQNINLSKSDLFDLAKTYNLKNEDAVKSCISNGTFNNWANSATNSAVKGPVPNSDLKNIEGTPTIIVNGVQYPDNPTDTKAFQAFVQQAAAA